MPERGKLGRLAAAIASTLALQSLPIGPSFALDLAYEASLVAGHSDNIRRTSTAEQKEDIAGVGLAFSLDQVSSRIQARAAADLAYHEYLDDTFDSEVIGNFAGDARFQIVPERFEWVVSDNYGQVLADPFLPATPENREDINYFTTGPGLVFGLGSQMQVRLAGRYSMVDYEDSALDSDVQAIEAGLVRLLSDASSVSINARTQEIEYDDRTLNSDYEQREAFLRYELSGARTNLGLDLGYTEVESDDISAEAQDGLLLRLEASRRLSTSSTATLRLGRDTSNSGTSFATMQTAGVIGLNTIPGRQTSAPFTNEYVNFGWDFARNRTGLGLFASWSEQQYEDTLAGLDQRLSSYGAYYSRQLSTRTSLQLNVDYERGEFEEGQGYKDLGASVSFNWRLSRSLSLNARYDRYDRNSDFEEGDSTENRYWLALTYGYGTPRRDYGAPSFGIDESN